MVFAKEKNLFYISYNVFLFVYQRRMILHYVKILFKTVTEDKKGWGGKQALSNV